MKAAILDNQNRVIFAADVTPGTRKIVVAGAVTADGEPVNQREYRVSYSKANLAKTADSFAVPELVQREHNGALFFVEG